MTRRKVVRVGGKWLCIAVSRQRSAPLPGSRQGPVACSAMANRSLVRGTYERTREAGPIVDGHRCADRRSSDQTMIVLFTLALFTGAAAIAAWIATRFPRLTPESMTVRLTGALLALGLLRVVRVDPGTYFSLYGTLFGVCLPALTLVWLGSYWLLRSLRDLVP